MGNEGAREAQATIAVEIAWVEADGAIGRRSIEMPAGSRVRDALALLREREPGLWLLEGLARGDLATAVYGTPCDTMTVLHPGDRIELVAGLTVDPKLARRRRAQSRRARAPGAGGGIPE